MPNPETEEVIKGLPLRYQGSHYIDENGETVFANSGMRIKQVGGSPEVIKNPNVIVKEVNMDTVLTGRVFRE